MPELPEVEIARRNLERWFARRTLVRAESTPTRIFRGAERGAFDSLTGKLQSAERRGKYLMLRFGKDGGLLAHLGMTGKFVRRPAGAEVPHSRARFVLDSGDVIHFVDPRMFGRMEPAPAAALPALSAVSQLGVDPLVDGLSAAQLREAVGASKQDLKVALMDQGRVAGLGNIHAAEALYRAKLHPARKPASLTAAEWARLAKAIGEALQFALRTQEADEISYVEEPGADNPFKVYGRGGEKCPRCKKVIASFVQGGRTTYYCPGCQEKP